jgi:hypothetical protein
MCTEGTASRPPTAKGSSDIGRVAPTSFWDVRDVLAVGLECTGTPGTALRIAMTTYTPNGAMYPPPAILASRNT